MGLDIPSFGMNVSNLSPDNLIWHLTSFFGTRIHEQIVRCVVYADLASVSSASRGKVFGGKSLDCPTMI